MYTVVTIRKEISSVLALPEGKKNSGERHRAVLSSKSFIKQKGNTSPRKDESELSGNQSVIQLPREGTETSA